MKKLKNIEWYNIYYFLIYAIDELKYFDPGMIDQENIKGTHDLLASLLCSSFELLYKNGYIKKYRSDEIITGKPYGIIDVPKSISTGSFSRGELHCEVYSLDTNNRINQIVKAAFTALIAVNNSDEFEDEISKLLLMRLNDYRGILRKVDNIIITKEMLNDEINIPEWYKPTYVVAKLILNEWLTKDSDGETRLLELNDQKRLCYIWEKYVRAFYKKNLTPLGVKVSNPRYTFGDEVEGQSPETRMLDILAIGDKVPAIFDTKWYESMGDPSPAQLYEYAGLFMGKDDKNQRFNRVNTAFLYAYSSSSISDKVIKRVAKKQIKYPNLTKEGRTVYTETILIDVSKPKEEIEKQLLEVAKRTLMLEDDTTE